MSNPNGPVRRRRIAGEAKPAVEPAEARRRLIPKAPRKPITPKPVAPAKAPVAKTASPVSSAKAPVAAVPTTETKTAKPARAGISLPPSTEWKWFLPLALIAVAAVVFGAVFAVKGVSDFREQRGIDSSNSRAAAKAGEAAEAIFSFQYNKLPEHLAKSKDFMTPGFQKEFDKIAPALTELAPQRKIVVKAQSRNAAALECGDECSSTKASILVFLDQARLIGDSKVPTVFGNRIVVDMIELNGAWLVNNIRAL